MSSQAAPVIPGGIAEVTPGWIEQTLQADLPGCRVESITVKRIGEGIGFLGELGRVNLTYAGEPPANAPASVIVKLPTNVPEPRGMAAALGFYEREVGFYRDLSRESDIRVPHAYYHAFEPETAAFALVLEDFPGAAAGDQLASCSVDQAQLAVRELARLHAKWWESPRLSQYAWLPSRGHHFFQILQAAHLQALPVFEEHWSSRFDPAVCRVARRLGERFDAYIESLMDRPLTLAHQDYRLDNMLFGTPGTAEEFILLDWQLVQQGTGLTDLQYFISSNLRKEMRERHTEDLVRLYHEGLREGGVSSYNLEECREDFARASAILGFYIVTGCVSIDPENYDERGNQLINLLYGSLADAMVEYEAERFLPA